MKKLLIALLMAALMLGNVALAEYRPATASPTPPPFGWVEGVVTDASNRSAKLAGVTVSADGKSVQTDAQGRYELQLSLGSQTLTFTKNGYVTKTATVTMQAGKFVTKDCALEPDNGRVKGVVSDAADPSAKLAGVTVSAGSKSVQTDAQGRYELQLSLGSQTLTFTKSGYVTKTENVTIQSGKVITKDCALEPDAGIVKGVVSDATNPSIKLSDVTVSADGKTAVTNARGEYELMLSPGAKTLTFTKDGYIETTANITVRQGRNVTQDCSMSRELSSNEYRVVLTWGSTPKDLDSHLLGKAPQGGSYHVYYMDKTPRLASGEAALDVDDTNSYGPETTTFTITNNATYVYYVLDYTNRNNSRSTQLASSGAKVEVYSGNERVQVYYVPSGTGVYWEVFRIENGRLITVDRITNTEPTR